MKFKTVFLFFLLIKNLLAYSHDEIIDAIVDVSRKEGVASSILYTIIKIESNFKPFAISFLTNKENALYFKSLETNNISIKISNYSLNRNKWVVAINPINEEYAKEILKLLIKNGFSVDVGLGQLNSYNFTTKDIENIFNPTYNLTKCAKVLRKCYKVKNKDLQKTIECYNYGMRNRNSNPYYKRFYEHYMKELEKRNRQ